MANQRGSQSVTACGEVHLWTEVHAAASTLDPDDTACSLAEIHIFDDSGLLPETLFKEQIGGCVDGDSREYKGERSVLGSRELTLKIPPDVSLTDLVYELTFEVSASCGKSSIGLIHAGAEIENPPYLDWSACEVEISKQAPREPDPWPCSLFPCAEGRSSLCHKPGSLGQKTMCISDNAVPSHLGHRDLCGPCP